MHILRVLQAIRPKDSFFFSAFAQHAKESLDAVQALYSMIEHNTGPECVYEHEHAADKTTRTIEARVRATMLAPFDRAEVLELTKAIDDIADAAKSIATSLHTTGIHIHTSRPSGETIQVHMQAMAKSAVDASTFLYTAITNLPTIQRGPGYIAPIQDTLAHIRTTESVGDSQYRQALNDIFTPYRTEKSTKNLAETLLYRDVLKEMERLIDRCEDAADVLDSILTNRA